MGIQVITKMLKKACFDGTAEWHKQFYLDGVSLKRRETRSFEKMSDTMEYVEFRDSEDNGRTWGPWQREAKAGRTVCGADEYEFFTDASSARIWNPVHNHTVRLMTQRIFIDGYRTAARLDWEGKPGFFDHGFLEVTDESGTYRQMVAYEPGNTVFSEDTYREPDYLKQNISTTYKAIVLSDGDILIGAEEIPMDKACAMLGQDVNQVFPSRPDHYGGILMIRGKWNNAEKRYDFSFGKPIILPDNMSSRGLMEPTFLELSPGRILLVMRSSNWVPPWYPEFCPHTPGFKYFCLSEDGGRTFSPIMPWFFDSREVVYSSSTYSLLFRSIKNNRVYWVGNITDPTKTAGNYPRYPLYIAQVDEKWGILKKDTLTVIDDRAEGETEEMQLSNFCILQNRENGEVEIQMTKLGQFARLEEPSEYSVFDGDVLQYTLILDD